MHPHPIPPVAACVSTTVLCNPHNGGAHHHHHQHHANNNGEYYHTTPAKRHRQSFTATSPATGSSLNVTSQGGYEDALTQFKGRELMTIWEHFVWDIIGTFGLRAGPLSPHRLR
uniref:Uncharacterized protein n=1 Tax=Anopheles farauti TaxID=69004 RepID=A0A182QDL7_9DIPT